MTFCPVLCTFSNPPIKILWHVNAVLYVMYDVTVISIVGIFPKRLVK